MTPVPADPHPHQHTHDAVGVREFAVQEYAAGSRPPEPPPRGLMGRTELDALFNPAQDGSFMSIVGQPYLDMLTEHTAIVEYQWRHNNRRSPVKGLMLAGPPGSGKTTMAKRLAYELGLRFGEEQGDVLLATIDGSEIARSRYGESEERIRAIFASAQSGFGLRNRRVVVLFDDVESIFMARDSEHSKEWHFAQDSVFFHAIDDLDSTRCVAVLTTNRPDLVDDAIRDRFLQYTFAYPSTDVLIEAAVRFARKQKFSEAACHHVEGAARQAADEGRIRSFRDVERLVVRSYIETILGRPSVAELSDPQYQERTS